MDNISLDERQSLLIDLFIAYVARKKRNKLYVDSNVSLCNATNPRRLIKGYYELFEDEIDFSNIKKSFVNKYVKNESQIEGVNDESIHGKIEMAGLLEMYNYIHGDEISNPDYDLSYYDLSDFHKKLFSKTEYPELGGMYRQMPAYLPGTGTELCDASMIREELYFLDKEMIQPLNRISKEIRNLSSSDEVSENVIKELENLGESWNEYSSNEVNKKTDAMLAYLDACIVLSCKLVKIHPFSDGNGRTIRGFVNKMLEDVGFPPIYVKANERTAYHKAMNIANMEADYNPSYGDIKQFYRYKICDSIIELDINDRVNEDYQNITDSMNQKDDGKPKIRK